MALSKEIKGYERTVLYGTDSFEVVSIHWSNSHKSVMHNHGWSQCSFLVQEGLFENTFDFGIKTEVRVLEVGQVLDTPKGARHQMKCLTPRGRTLHVYSPKIIDLPESGKFFVPSIASLKNELALTSPTKIDELNKIISTIREYSIGTHSPYFMNQLFSGVLPQMLLSQELLSQTKTTLATREASPTFSAIESEVIEALGKLIGWQSGQREGVCVPGGSAANFMALHCARQKSFPEIKKKGMTGEKLRVFVSTEAHYSFKKACVALGLGTESLVTVPVDENGRMKADVLDQYIDQHKSQGATPILVCATAGTTVLGAFDPIQDLSRVCKKHNLWLHVDAAWGGPAIFSKKLKSLVKGIEQADSVTFDAHKLFGAGLTCSFFLTKHPGLLLEANDVSGGDYLFHPTDSSSVDLGKLSWQCGRSADAFSFWTIWKSAGTDGLGAFVDRFIDIREKTLEWINAEPGLQLVTKPEYLNVCVRVLPPSKNKNETEWSKYVREKLKEKNLAMVNYSSDENGTFLRLILAHPHLEFKHVKQILDWALEVE